MSDLGLSRVEIVPDDRDPQATFDEMLAAVQAALPTWDARNGSLEVVLLEAFAVGAADIIYALNRLPGRIEEDILALYDVARYAGAVATGSAVITLDESRTVTISEGTRLGIPDGDIVLEVTADTTATGATITVPVQATEPSATPNALAANAPLDVIDSIPYAISVALSGTMTGGADPETDDTYLARAATRLARVTSSLVVADHFVAYALESPVIRRAKAYDLWDGVGANTESDLGYVTVAVYGIGAQVDADVRATLETDMTTRSAAMMTPVVIEADITTVDIAATIAVLAGYSSTAVRDACEAALRAFVNPATWEWDDDVRPNDLIAVLSAVEGVDYVDSITDPAGVTPISAPAGLAEAGTVTITVLP
jgi:uncharacterized phage protein gp47/JayE